VQSLVEKGMATISRRSELERLLANAQFDRLTQMTAILRAQQSLSEANRNAAALQDERQTEIAQELQSEQANLEALELQHATALKLLLQLDLSAPQTMAAGTGEPQLGYTIVRQGAAEPQVLTAAENSELIPGDVLKVVVVPPRTEGAPGSAVAGVDP
jgi:polysaccharide export outer membrane protein